jgi:isochorismate hydrolase
VQITAMDAFLREFKVWVPADCSAAETPQAHEASLAYMAGVLKCDIGPAAPRWPARKKKSA